jgi:segregation and condensation protein A
MEDYRVQLDFYDGPMDLLLYLVRKDEVDIHDIPIARITGQYCRYVEMLRAVDINLAGEFLLMAAWLMEIKTRMLLPTGPAEPAEGAEGGEPAGSAADALADPRAELVRQLLAYKQFKDLADELGQAAAAQALKYPRAGLDWDKLAGEAGANAEPAVDLGDVHIWDLFDAFGKLMEATGRHADHQVVYDDTPIHEHAADIVDRLTSAGSLQFDKLFEGHNRGQILGLFLAMLELIRQKRIRVLQEQTFGAIVLKLRDPEESPVEANAPNGEADAAATPSTAEPGADQKPAESSRTIAEKIARRKAARVALDESAGVTWVEPAEDSDSLDAGLQAIDQELRAIRIPPDPELLLRDPIPEPPAAAPAPDAPVATAVPDAPSASDAPESPIGEAGANATPRTEQPPTEPAEPSRG